ncbi:class I SAM-dependent methyltransferase [Pisciglobus halotolerans]|uniref:16S rRNA m(2)G 1207 methyltransferase n=1 Tax=Pisciglobus halotolerans TaxID=745365 RepID=A0A1I3B6H7_9LACT|nr:class I SAM-dependent methyltransferase [Pisciglobus halotolerans]SFH57888.1 16S rRNA m(2)G 1207 methyltransferase [Pisciglobus halotolerans]
MADHYYTNKPHAESDESTWTYTLLGQTFRFTSDTGVFSKRTIDFGSRLLIETMDFSSLPSGNLLDVGCGYGPIGLAFAKTEPAREVEMVDVNERAVALARKNAAQNEINNVNIHVSNIYEAVEGKKLAAVVSNPPIRAGKKVVHEILTGSYPLLAESGVLVIVIQKKQGAPSAQKKMAETFGNVEIVEKDKGYWILKSVKITGCEETRLENED